VKVHRSRAMEKMHAQSVADLVRMTEKLKGRLQKAS
jgi:FixJ family two-component response regulator